MSEINNNIENEETAVAVVTPASDITSLFANINFQQLNSAIEDIANADKTLSEKEKEFAVSVIDKWEVGVVEQLENENEKVRSFVRYVKNFTQYYSTIIGNPEYEEPISKLIEIAGLSDKTADISDYLNEVNALKAELDSLENELELSRADDATVTKLERLEREYEAAKECSIKREEYNKASRKLNRALSEFTSALNKNENVQTALNKLTSFARILTKNKNECATKASSAKLAIAIDDKDLREKLNALISITVK